MHNAVRLILFASIALSTNDVVTSLQAVSNSYNTMTVTTSSRPTTKLYGVLSRSIIAKHASKKKRMKNNKHTNNDNNEWKNQAFTPQVLSKSYLLNAVGEALFCQNLALEAVNKEIKRIAACPDSDETKNQTTETNNNNNLLDEEQVERSADNTSRSSVQTNRVSVRKEELNNSIAILEKLKIEIQRTNLSSTTKSNSSKKDELDSIKQKISDLGFESIFNQPMELWKSSRNSTKKRKGDFGRPQGFDGIIYYSDLGVPILVGKMGASRDDTLRRIAQGTDLWFQVEDYNGSRVLLRQSLIHGTKNSKKCRQAAANIAAKYSIQGECGEKRISVMYTDSRKVAKRGSKVGSMKKNKKLGRIFGYPEDADSLNRIT